MTSSADSRIEVPEALVSWHRKWFGETGRAWIDAAPDLAASLLDRWQLRPDGDATCGAVALVLPVLRADGTPAVLKLQPVTGDTVGEADALRAWNGNGAVRLLDHDPASSSMLLERLDADHSLATVLDDIAALQILSELLARLSAIPAPAGIRLLSDFGADLLDRAYNASLTLVRDPSQTRLVQSCASALAEVLPEAGDRLLHEDLHYFNILAPRPADPREAWLAIDPNPLAGDPGFELLPALHNRWEEAVATGDVPRAIRRRFDLMTDILGLDRKRATAWTLARVLQYALRDIEHDDTIWHSEPDRAIAQILLDRAG